MNLIRKIKSYFIRHEFSSWKNLRWDDHEINFRNLSEEMLLDIGSFIKSNLQSSDQIGNERHRLREDRGIRCESLDQLLPLIREIVEKDYKDTSKESGKYNWDFKYFVSPHLLCKNTICISNGLKAMDREDGKCIYPLVTIRKFDGAYFCWNHLS